MGESFSVDEKLKDDKENQLYVFYAIEHNDYPGFRYAISKPQFSANPNLIYEGEGKKIEWKFKPSYANFKKSIRKKNVHCAFY